MKRILLAGATVLALTAAQPTLAADAPVYRGPAPYAVALFNWSGFYVGGFLGSARAGNVTATDLFSQGGVFPVGTPYNGSLPYSYGLGSSFLGGLTIGANWQAPGSALVLGVEGEIGWLRLIGSRADPASPGLDTVSTTKLGDWYGAITGRLGFAVDRVLFYVKGGVAFVDSSASTIDACIIAPCGGGLVNATGSKVQTGWALGGGLEWALDNRWSLKAEYLWLGLNGNIGVCGAGAGTAAGSVFCGTHTLPNGIQTGKIGLNFRM